MEWHSYAYADRVVPLAKWLRMPIFPACFHLSFACPTKGTTVPDGPDWLHEVKYDGYRLRLERDGDRVRLITRGGYNWGDRYPWIVEAARKISQKHFVLDGEAVVLGLDGVSDFNALHSRKHDHEVQFCAFDILAEGSDDLRMLPLSMRKASLERLLARRPEGVFVNPFERGELGLICFELPATSALRGWCPSGGTVLMRAVAVAIGSK
ncbi:RNA ligase family protein [Bradyrhizobium sp. PRIMUS42]|uniref:ATP-dependent DNA ligase n=1 Tax=Bradyrhizobium sp. PRIMUS42 TaxID=2908926 RepID=UPI00286803BA|nr:RNA ligase family protein [Bradyrhizobium sp. PRIMUS42]